MKTMMIVFVFLAWRAAASRLSADRVPSWAGQKHLNHGDKCSYSITFLQSTLSHDIVVSLTKINIFF